MLAETNNVPSRSNSFDNRYVQPRAYFKLDDHRFDRLPMVGEGQWEDHVNPAQEDTTPVTDMPMTEIVRK
jgi:hypothetical protein